MAKNKQQPKPKKQTPTPVVAPPPPVRVNYLLLTAILFATLFIYWPSLENELTNWDDKNYISINTDLADASIHKHFVEKPHVMGNYHPLSMLTLAWNYQSAFDPTTGKIDPVPFHRTNLIIHVLNALLVYLVFFRLTKSNYIAAFTSAAFALHPMHVESVAWAAERKDVLYTFFYLAATLVWLYYIQKKNKIVFYAFAFALFLLALFSKAVAVTLPILLLAVDYFAGRKLNWKVLAEKIPFLIVSVYFGMRAIEAQREFESLSGNEMFSFGDRIIFACYGTMQYIVKFFTPTDLSCFYTLPPPGYDRSILYTIAPIFVAVLGVVIFYFRKNRTIIFGALFFFITVALVLQLMSVGGAVMADRYSYLPHIGLAFVVGSLLYKWFDAGGTKKLLAIGIPVVFLVVMTWLTFERTKVWKDSVTLWTDAESKEKLSPKLYCNFGDAYTVVQQYDKALEMLNKSLALKPDYPDALYNRGLVYFYIKQYDKAIADYSAAIQHKPDLKEAWHNRAGTYFTVGMYKEALVDATKARDLGYPVDPMFFKVLNEALAKPK